MLPDRDTVTFIRLKVTEISMFFIRLYMNLLLSFRFFGLGSISFYFHRLKIIIVRYKNTQRRKANVSATYGAPLQCYNLKD